MADKKISALTGATTPLVGGAFNDAGNTFAGMAQVANAIYFLSGIAATPSITFSVTYTV